MTEPFSLLTIALVGFRHGFDLDHIAAISDIAAAARGRRRALFLATLYALGHAMVVFALGLGVAAAGALLPARLDAMMGRVTGSTLVALGIYVLHSLARHGAGFELASRGGMVVKGVRGLRSWIARRGVREIVVEHEHEHTHGPAEAHHEMAVGASSAVAATRPVATLTRHSHHHTHRGVEPRDPFAGHGPVASLGIGMIHGVGAETPTQLLVLITAAGVAELGHGVLVVGAFVVGLVVANTVLAVAGAISLSGSRRLPRLYAVIAALSGAFSIALGMTYLIG
ncbi:MAG TPA: hypothetical protein VHJ82_04150 [Actinomycetota bacterium]|nr:hypothetical protein [Actinomycetota bacterium]